MAGSVNKVIVVGNVGKDPEVRATQSGDKIANLSIATSETWNDRASGERKERTEWHRVVVFNPRLAEVVEKYVTKGAKLYVEGSLQTRKWTDQQGNDRYSTEIVLQNFNGTLTLLDKPASRDEAPRQERPPARQAAREPARTGGGGGWNAPQGGGDLDDEIPFGPNMQ